jgi:hypothetical protein
MRFTNAAGKEQVQHAIYPAFLEDWYQVDGLDAFVYRYQVDVLWPRKDFNHMIRPYTDVEDTARLLNKETAGKAAGVCYRPDVAQGIVNLGGGRYLNIFRPSGVRPIVGDPKPFVDFMAHLIPDERDRREVLRWLATLACRPSVRMMYALLLISKTQGVGKSTLAYVASQLVGMHNVSFPEEKMIVDGSFTGWLAHKRLVVVHEIYGGHSRRSYDVTKDKITEMSINVNRKFIPDYTIDNWAHFLASSNSIRAIHLDDEDRRFLVPGVTEELKPREYWVRLRSWLQGEGMGVVLHYLTGLIEADLTFAVGAGEHAPMTTAKEEVVRESRSEGQALAYDLAEQTLRAGRRWTEEALKKGKTEDEALKAGKIVMVLDDIRTDIAFRRSMDRDDRRMESAYTIRRALVAGGLTEAPQRFTVRKYDFGQLRSTDERNTVKAYVVANFEIGADAQWRDLKDFRRVPDDVREKEDSEEQAPAPTSDMDRELNEMMERDTIELNRGR